MTVPLPRRSQAARACLGLALLFAACGSTEPATSAPPTSAPPAVLPAPPGPLTADGWWRDAVFYEIFVRSFQDSDGDGVGDLRGVTQRLDYLADLGVRGLWLMPIQPSPSYHGYDVTDYGGVNPDYGTMADLEALVAAARARGIGVITDFVLNHSSSQHPWFIDAKTGPGARYRDYYTWAEAPIASWRRPWDGANVWHEANGSYYYGLFWSGMPDLNLGNAELAQRMVDTMSAWLDRGLAGFRVDAARYLFETPDGVLADLPRSIDFITRVREATRAAHPDALFVAEAWTSEDLVARYYGEGGDAYQLAFSFDLAGAMLAAVNGGSRSELVEVLRRTEANVPDRGFEAPFLTNHDMPRLLRQLGGDVRKNRLAVALLMSMPGTPFLYYGEEIGLQGGAGSEDENKRTPMRWTAGGETHGFTTAGAAWYPQPKELDGTDVETQRGEAGSLWTLYQRHIALRTREAALRRGAAVRAEITEGGTAATFAMLRELPADAGGERVLAVYNLGGEAAAPFRVAVSAAAPRVLLGEGLAGAIGPGETVLIPALAARGFAFIQLGAR